MIPSFVSGISSCRCWAGVRYSTPSRGRYAGLLHLSPPRRCTWGVCGNTGHTAYIDLTDIILLEKGDVIFISAATGAVGLHCVPDRTATWSNGDRLGRRSGES